MREVISIQVGECGNKIGHQFWENIANEHNVSLDGKFIQAENQVVSTSINYIFRKKQMSF